MELNLRKAVGSRVGRGKLSTFLLQIRADLRRKEKIAKVRQVRTVNYAVQLFGAFSALAMLIPYSTCETTGLI